MTDQLTALEAGMRIPWGGNRVSLVDAALATAFQPGDRLIVVQTTGDLLRIPSAVAEVSAAAVGRAAAAFAEFGAVEDEAITAFYEAFAGRLEDTTTWERLAAANAADVQSARQRGRSTTRLVVTDAMRRAMIDGLRLWGAAPSPRDALVDLIVHDGWWVEQRQAGLGVVGFVFEGRPNVFADACGVLRSGNTVVFRIGSDALGTARAMMAEAVVPALASAGLPAGAVSLVDAPEHAAGWAMFADPRLGLAVARGSGTAVAQLGAVARQTGTPVSLHGTGGAWLVAAADADADRFAQAVYHSLDRKVCNSLNVCVIDESAAGTLVPILIEQLARAGERRGHGWRLHVVDDGSEARVDDRWFELPMRVRRADGDRDEVAADLVIPEAMATEWEWEETPEVTLRLCAGLDEAIDWCNRYSPRLVASLISQDPAAHERFYQRVDAPFVGDGFTRWVDGQYALLRPELGLSNWQSGRLFGRGGVLSGDSVYTVRTRMHQHDPGLHR